MNLTKVQQLADAYQQGRADALVQLADMGDDRSGVDGGVVDRPHDPVNHPAHYQKEWGEVIQITETMNFCLGNAVKYILRSEDKGNFKQDIEKAIWYLNRELKRRS